MEDDDDVIYQGEFFKLSESRKRLIGSKADSWKQKYLIFRHKGEKPILEYHKKKPKTGKKSERTLTDTFELWPTYKVEKLKNARGRVFVCEITSADYHIFLSADEETQIDVLVFLLQVQIRLKDNIRKDLISVVPEDSECQQKIGAKGSKCVLHASPWGLTLALEQTRALLAQWPLKSIRYYEASGTGHFNIEAGRVAPMGEGLFKFKTQSGDDDFMYDLVDSYIVNTLDRVKPTQKGTPEEIEDYIREHDHLHSLTTVSICLPRTPEISKILHKIWGMGSPSPASSSRQSRSPRGRGQSSQSASSTNVSQAGSQSSSLVINLERPGESSSDSHRSSADNRSSGRPVGEDSRVTERPPPLPARSTNGSGAPRRSRRRDHSIPRKVDVVTAREGETKSLSLEGNHTPEAASPRRHSNPSDVIHKINPNDSLSTNLSINVNLAQNHSAQHHHTEFYNLSSPNMKVRVSKSPIITKNPNKVGRAEYLLNLQQSGVKSPAIAAEPWDLKAGQAGEQEHQEALEYLDAVAKASQQKYGGHNSIDRRWVKMRRDLSSSEQSTTSSDSPRVSANLCPSSGYVNLPHSPQPEIRHSRQRSAPDTMLDTSALHLSRQSSRDSSATDHTLSPPQVRHERQRSADEVSRSSFGSIDPKPISDNRPQSAGSGRRSMDESRHSRQNSVTSARSHRSRRDSDEILEPDVPGGRDGTRRQLSQFSGLDRADGAVGEWLMSASCEDLSDHMRTVIYDDDHDHLEGPNAYDEIDETKVEGHQMTVSSTGSGTSSDKPPLPFTDLKKFHNHLDTSNYNRDRSKSFGYMNLPGGQISAGSKPQSTAPSAHLIRKMVNARAKQETLRKSLSNPNFLNLGSKEHLFNLKSSASGSNGSSTKLAPQHKQKSRSFGSLFPAIKKALSRESLGHSRSTTPERKGSRSTTPERRSSFSFRRRSSDSDNLKRQNSFHSYGEMTIKGIRMTERSRSFRRVRAAKSAEVLSKADDSSDMNRLSSATTVSSPATTTPDTPQPPATDDSNRASAVSTRSEPVTATNPNYTAMAQISLTSPTVLPLPDPDQPPPLPAPRKPSTSSHMKKSGSSSSGFSESLPYQNTPGNVQEDNQAQPEKRKSKRPLVSDLVAKLEENNNGSNNSNKNSSNQDSKPPQHRRSQHRESAPIPKGKDTSDVKKRQAASQIVETLSSRANVNSHRTSAHKEKTASQHGQDKRSSTTSTGSKGSGAHKTRESGSHMSESKNRTSGHSQTGSSTDSNRSSASVVAGSQSVPKPFQPIPFKRQQNGIRPVQPPTSAKPESKH